MQLVSLGVYNQFGDRRDLFFKLRSLNILTGRSRTGKSAVLDIVEFCLGRDTVTISEGTVSDHAAWYYLIVEFKNERVLLCRPNPSTASTNRAMIRFGDLELTAPEFQDLEVNADTDVLRDVLSERLEIERFTVEPDQRSLRTSFQVSVRQALFMCFQSQDEIASRTLLFHRQADKNVKEAIRESLPYFLGVSTPEQANIRRQLVAARRALRGIENRLQAAEADLDVREVRVAQLIRSAIGLGLLPDTAADSTAPARNLLSQALSFTYPRDGFVEDETVSRRGDLVEEGRALRGRLREIDDQIVLLKRLQNDQSSSDVEYGFQHDRLRALDLLLPKKNGTDNATSTCPLCDQNLHTPDESISDLRHLLATLEERLSASRGATARREATIERIGGVRKEIVAAIGDNVIDLDALSQQEAQIAAGRERGEQIAFLQGRVSQELERGVDFTDDLGSLRDSERLARGHVARLEHAYEDDNPASALEGAMDSLSELMTDYAQALELEGSQHTVRLDPSELTVVIQRPGGRIPLARMGSAANLIGYHLVAHLALHHWFVTHDRPVPRFLMFDQPTQAFFPEKVVDAADHEDADWKAVRQLFTLMRDVVSSLDGDLQVIVCDHANLSDPWFADSVIENWRNGVALIPTDWLTADEPSGPRSE